MSETDVDAVDFDDIDFFRTRFLYQDPYPYHEYLRSHGLHWAHLFPSLQHSEGCRAAAFAALEAVGAPVFFHGHTHSQEAWQLQQGEGPLRIEAAACADGELFLEDGNRWLVGVGSVGDPHDGAGACYALYDTETLRLVWRRV